jgi:predicted MFS family arabinose efflux permease
MVVNVDWRFIYWLTSGLAVLSWIVLVIFTPETRWIRTPEELGMYLLEVSQADSN